MLNIIVFRTEDTDQSKVKTSNTSLFLIYKKKNQHNGQGHTLIDDISHFRIILTKHQWIILSATSVRSHLKDLSKHCSFEVIKMV